MSVCNNFFRLKTKLDRHVCLYETCRRVNSHLDSVSMANSVFKFLLSAPLDRLFFLNNASHQEVQLQRIPKKII